MVKLSDCPYDGSSKFELAEYPASDEVKKSKRAEVEALMNACRPRLA